MLGHCQRRPVPNNQSLEAIAMTSRRKSAGPARAKPRKHVSTTPTVVPFQLELAASVLCKRWKLGIVWLLLAGCERFGELATALPGVSAKVLAQQLRELEQDGLVQREIDGSASRHACYSLSGPGHRLADLLRVLNAWGAQYHKSVPSSAARHGLAQSE
jgi:DNA-binding HxlR family transcriptional regulator